MEDMDRFKSNIIQESVTYNHAFSYDSPSDCIFIWWTSSYFSRLTSSSIHKMLCLWTIPDLCTYLFSQICLGFPGGTSSKEPACQCRRHNRCAFDPWVGKIPWRWAWQLTLYSCLENPMDRGDWWARVHRVTQRWTRLKQLSTHTHTHTHTPAHDFHGHVSYWCWC